MDNLTEKRAKFVYESARLAAICAEAPVIPAPWEEREDAFRSQFLKVIERQCGERRSRSSEELHGSWMQAYFAMGWVFGEKYDRENKTHPDLVPYADLGQLERDKDAVFVSLCEIARRWIYEDAIKPKCCFIPDNEQGAAKKGESVLGCRNDAEWQIVSGASDADYTESCTEHVGALLTDAVEHRIYHI